MIVHACARNGQATAEHGRVSSHYRCSDCPTEIHTNCCGNRWSFGHACVRNGRAIVEPGRVNGLPNVVAGALLSGSQKNAEVTVTTKIHTNCCGTTTAHTELSQSRQNQVGTGKAADAKPPHLRTLDSSYRVPHNNEGLLCQTISVSHGES